MVVIVLVAIVVSSLQGGANAQLAAVFSQVSQSNECSTWSSWGPCIWPEPDNSIGYLDQLTPYCKQHWFYSFLRRYSPALDSFYAYMNSVMKSKKPCGMCSYKQSCGFGGPSKCNLSPFNVKGSRPLIPFFVAERLCSARDLGGDSQIDSCIVDYDVVKENGGECTLWPTNRVNISVVEPHFREQLMALKWYTCRPRTKRVRHRDGRITKERSCRCCCYPFQPNPKTFKCEHIPNSVTAPGEELFDESFGDIGYRRKTDEI